MTALPGWAGPISYVALAIALCWTLATSNREWR